MRLRILLISSIIWVAVLAAGAQDLVFTTTGSCASYITWNNATSHQADSIYLVKKTNAAIVVDGVAEDAWTKADPAVIKKIAHEKKEGEVLDFGFISTIGNRLVCYLQSTVDRQWNVHVYRC